MEREAVTDLERPGEAVVGDLPALGEQGDERVVRIARDERLVLHGVAVRVPPDLVDRVDARDVPVVALAPGAALLRRRGLRRRRRRRSRAGRGGPGRGRGGLFLLAAPPPP